MSVITAPAARNRAAVPVANASAMTASRRERPASHPQTSQAIAHAPSQWGRRAANSLTPIALKLAALIQKDRGGLPQNGTPWSNHGVTQSPSSAILRAISA